MCCRKVPSSNHVVDNPLACPFNLESCCSLENVDCFEEEFPPECPLEKEEYRTDPDYYENE
jgi:hypothetical protein